MICWGPEFRSVYWIFLVPGVVNVRKENQGSFLVYSSWRVMLLSERCGTGLWCPGEIVQVDIRLSFIIAVIQILLFIFERSAQPLCQDICVAMFSAWSAYLYFFFLNLAGKLEMIINTLDYRIKGLGCDHYWGLSLIIPDTIPIAKVDSFQLGTFLENFFKIAAK